MDGSSGTILTSDLAGKIEGAKEKLVLKHLPRMSRQMVRSDNPVVVQSEQERVAGKGEYGARNLIYYQNGEISGSRSLWALSSSSHLTTASGSDNVYMTYTDAYFRFEIETFSSNSSHKIGYVATRGTLSGTHILGTVTNLSSTKAVYSSVQGPVQVLLNNKGGSVDQSLYGHLEMLVIPEDNPPANLVTLSDPNHWYATVLVHDSKVQAYKTATNWSAIADHIFPMSAYNNWID